MYLLRRTVAALAGGFLALAAGGLPAHADATLDEIAAAVGVTEQPTDFVIIVDTSLSMQEEGRWTAAREAVSGLITNLSPDDYATVITFDDGARVVYAGQDPSASEALDRLPAQPTGDQTDIGAAIELGVEALNRDGAADVAAIALLTDGELDAADNSDYVTADAPAWKDLRAEADRVTDGREVGAFAIALGPDSDAGLLSKVFPDAAVGTPDDVVVFLTGLNDALTVVRIREAVKPDQENPATIAVDDVTTADDGSLTATVRFTSTTTYLPLTVASIELEPVVDGVAYGIDPSTLELEPGAEGTADFFADLPPGTDTSAAIVATLTSPWQPQLAQLGIDEPLTVTSDPIAMVAGEDAGNTTPEPEPEPDRGTTAETGTTVSDILGDLPPWAIPAAIGAVVILAVVWALAAAARKRRPRVDGSLALIRDGAIADEFVVAGPEAKATRGDLHVRARKLKNGSVEVQGRQGKAKFSASLSDGGTATLPDGATLRYTEQRTRMIDMVTDGHGLPTAEKAGGGPESTVASEPDVSAAPELDAIAVLEPAAPEAEEGVPEAETPGQEADADTPAPESEEAAAEAENPEPEEGAATPEEPGDGAGEKPE